MWLVIPVVVVLAMVLAWICTIYVVQFLYTIKLPGPQPSPILGNLGLVQPGKPLFEVYGELQKRYGNMFVFYMGVDPIVVITDHQAAREVLTKKFKAFHDRPLLAPIMAPKRSVAAAAGILFAKGSLWTSLRAAAQPVFHADSLSQYAKIMNNASTAQLAGAAKLAESGAVFNFGDLAGSMTMRVIMQCAFGIDLDTQGDGPEHPAISAAKEFFNRSALRSRWFLFIMSIPKLLRPLARRMIYNIGDFKKMEAARDTLYSISNLLSRNFCKAANLPPFVADKDLLGKGESCQVLPADVVPSENSVIAAMMHAKDKNTGAPLNATQLLAQGNTFILAGYETTAGAVTFAVYLLALNPDVESKLLKEIDSVGRDKCPTYETLDQWPYAKACVRETMRKYPVAPMLLRTCVQATTVGGVHIPKGVDVHIPLPFLHNNPEHFPEPEKFRPERFLEAEAQGNPDLHPAYMPFGAGPHNCIGWRFAMEEAVIMLVRLYQKFIFRLSETHHPPGVELPIRTSITISPRDGLWVKAISR